MTVKTVLIVDDSRVARMMTGHMVSKLHPDWTVVEADNGDHAIDMFPTLKPDIVLMDMNMPGRDGLNASAELRKLAPGLPICLLTANIQDHIRVHAEEMGLVFMAKPLDEARLQAFLDGEDRP